MAVALTLTLIFRVEVGRYVWLACLAVESGCGGRVWFVRFFVAFFVKTFHRGGLRVCGFGW